MKEAVVSIHISTHPLVQHCLTVLRDKTTPSPLFRGMVQHCRQRRQKIADDCARFLALKALRDDLIDLRLIDLIDESLAEIFYQTSRIFWLSKNGDFAHTFALSTCANL